MTMDDYKKLVKELITQEIGEYTTWNEGSTVEDAMRHMHENGYDNAFGNVDGSRTCSTYEAQQFIDNSGAMWDDEIHGLFNDIEEGYFENTLKRGAEVLDVVLCELVADGVLYDMAKEVGVEL
jgi:hypothetical protein